LNSIANADLLMHDYLFFFFFFFFLAINNGLKKKLHMGLLLSSD